MSYCRYHRPWLDSPPFLPTAFPTNVPVRLESKLCCASALLAAPTSQPAPVTSALLRRRLLLHPHTAHRRDASQVHGHVTADASAMKEYPRLPLQAHPTSLTRCGPESSGSSERGERGSLQEGKGDVSTGRRVGMGDFIADGTPRRWSCCQHEHETGRLKGLESVKHQRKQTLQVRRSGLKGAAAMEDVSQMEGGRGWEDKGKDYTLTPQTHANEPSAYLPPHKGESNGARKEEEEEEVEEEEDEEDEEDEEEEVEVEKPCCRQALPGTTFADSYSATTYVVACPLCSCLAFQRMTRYEASWQTGHSEVRLFDRSSTLHLPLRSPGETADIHTGTDGNRRLDATAWLT
ncbi:unnamed protein product [Arctogadus glacialis]